MIGYRINSIETLCNFIIIEKPSIDKLNQLLWHLGIKAIFTEDMQPEQFCQQVKNYWQKWHHTNEKPIFIDVDLSVL